MRITNYKLILCVALSALASQSTAQSYWRFVHKADSCFKIGEYDNSLKFYSQAFAIKANVPRDLYNAACSAALGGADHFAVALLRLSVDNGWTDINHLESDADLRTLHVLPEWSSLVNDLRNKVDKMESLYDRNLQEKLLAIYEADQEPRRELSGLKRNAPEHKVKADSLLRVMHRTDSLNIIEVTGILDQHGWVGRDLVGEKASDAIFIVIQRANLQTQIKYFPLLKDAVERKVVKAELLAFLEDRIAIGEGREQVYGSQFGFNDETKKYYVLPVKDPHDIDKRRESVGLIPMSEYARMYGFTWDPKAQQKVK